MYEAEAVEVDHLLAAVGELRFQIDTLDTKIIEILKERRDVSRQIQLARMKTGGDRVEPARERVVISRYAGAFGRAGAEVATAMLRVCRG
jgi:chorismate mutase